jgi:hypothetical protein
VIKKPQRRRPRPNLGYSAIGWMDVIRLQEGNVTEVYTKAENCVSYAYNIILRELLLLGYETSLVHGIMGSIPDQICERTFRLKSSSLPKIKLWRVKVNDFRFSWLLRCPCWCYEL